MFETGGVAKKSATSGVEGGLGSGEKCISKRSSIWEGAIMLGDGVEQGGNKHALAETGGNPYGTLEHTGAVEDPLVKIGANTLGASERKGLGNGALVEQRGNKFVTLPAEV